MVARYTAWIARHRVAVIVGSIAFAIAAGAVAAQISIRADFSYLLPQSARSVQDLRHIEKRARAIGTAMVALESDHPGSRAKAAALARDRIEKLGPDWVASIAFDERVKRRYVWDHRWLLAPLADLKAARDALVTEIEQAKLRANPLYIPLDDEPTNDLTSDTLRDKLATAEREKADPGELVSKDGRVQMMILRTGFSTGDVDRDRILVAKLNAIGAEVRAAFPDVAFGIAGDAVVSLAEHDAILNGMLRATLLTMALVAFGLLWYFRSLLAIGALSWSLVVGTLATFAFAKLTLGYLNAATAFLSSIVIGNGINFGILITSRYFEELRAGKNIDAALAGAVARTLAGTGTAALTAAVAYASLMITVFRGFRHFGLIGGVGILACWIAAYVVLPAALAVAGRRIRPAAPAAPWLGKLLPHRLDIVALLTLALTAVAGFITFRFLTHEPFETNFRNLRSHSPAIVEAQRWMTAIDRAFGQGRDGGFVIAVPRREDTPTIVAKLRAVDAGKSPQDRLFADVVSFDDLRGGDQTAKLTVLAEIRSLLSSKDIEALDDDQRAELLRLRPPEYIETIRDSDVPDELASPFIESDGSRGKLILATAGKSYEVWDTRDTVRFAANVRALGLPDDVHFGGASFVFADVIDGVLRDGPRATLAAAVGATLIVVLFIGFNRFGLVTVVCGLSGTLMMLAVSALAGLKVNFLDFVALPITIGIGIDYAVNIVARARLDGMDRGRDVLASTGAAVTLCSYTTTVGYGSLLLSQNLGIRSFGIAAMVGEIMCLVVALVLAPALLWLLRPRGVTGTLV